MLKGTARLRINPSALEELLKKPIDWDLVISEGYRHGTISLINKHLSGDIGGKVPAAVRRRLNDAYLNLTASGLHHVTEFKRFTDATNEAGIEIIVLKGMALAESIYGDIGLRPLSDIDILVKENDWSKIYQLSAELGYKNCGYDFADVPPKITSFDTQAHIQYFAPSGICLEFQFDLLTIGIGMKDIQGVWQRARDAKVYGQKVKVLSPEDQLLHLVVHANRHGCTRLKWMVDIVESLNHGPAIDWDVLETIAERERVATVFYLTLEHVGKLMGAQLMSNALQQRALPKLYKRIIWKSIWPRRQLYRFEGRMEDGICYYFYKPFSGWNLLNFALTGRISDKISYQARWIIPSREWMEKKYGEQKILKLLKYYPLRLVSRHRR